MMIATAARPAVLLTHHALGPLTLTQRGLVKAIGAPLSWTGEDLPPFMLDGVFRVLVLRVLQPSPGN